MATIKLRSNTNLEQAVSANAVISSVPLLNLDIDNNFNNLNNAANNMLLKSGGSITGDLTISGNTTLTKLISPEIVSEEYFFQESNYASLHRSPNAITAMFVYDVSKDSDGGAWTEKCQHTSWYNEELCGKWLGARASESAARLVGSTNDYYQLTTNGKFYKLNVGSGTTEVFRGNKRSFPKLSAIVGEADNINIYDLTEPNRPMWMRFIATSTATISLKNLLSGANVAIAINGTIYSGGSSTNAAGLSSINFIKDKGTLQLTSGYTWNGNISTRNNIGGYANIDSTVGGIINNIVSGVTAATLPDAPVDPVTGLKVPTIAVAMGTTSTAGISIIKHNGIIVNGSSTNPYASINIHKNNLIASKSGNFSGVVDIADSVATLGANFTFNSFYSDTEFAPSSSSVAAKVVPTRDREIIKIPTFSFPRERLKGNLKINKLKYHKLGANNSLSCKINEIYNTGWSAGDVRRIYLSDSDVNPLSDSGELWPNPNSDTLDVSAWFSMGGNTVPSISNNTLILTTTTNGYIAQKFSITPNTKYRFGFGLISSSISPYIYIFQSDSSAVTNTNAVDADYNFLGSLTLIGFGGAEFKNTSTEIVPTKPYVYFGFYSAGSGQNVFDNFTLRKVETDRSRKLSYAIPYGTITKSQVASNTSLVAYSGFSANNYIREPYSSDLDFGTGEWNVSAWVNVPVNNSSNGTIISRSYSSGPSITLSINANNKFTTTIYDGSNTRTVTTTSAYNTATWTKVESNYAANGNLSILINGTFIANTSGSPLSTANNANAVFTIGNSYALDAPFSGSIALVKASATVPTTEQSIWMYEQEKQLFANNAQCVLPSYTNVLDLAYDDRTDTWIATQAGFESTWSGLIRTANTPVPSGSFAKTSAASGIRLSARTTTNPGVDVSMPKINLKELNKVNKMSQENNLVVFDFDGTSTQNTFPLSSGYTKKAVYVNGVEKREGSTKDYTVSYDGFIETINFSVVPNTWVQIHATKV